MLEPLLAFGAIGALLAFALIMYERRLRAERRLKERRRIERERAREPEVVQPPYEGATCAYCEQEIRHQCRLCARPTCDAHWPSPAERLCTGCVGEWQRTAPRRRLHLAVLTLGAMAVAAGLVVGIGAAFYGWRAELGFFAVLAGAILGTPMLFGADHLLRRRFRPSGRVPVARVKRR